MEFDNWIDEYIDYLPLNCKVLDLGCGRGEYSKYLIDKGYDVISADISDIALSKVKTFNKNIIKLDMRDLLPFEDNKFDIVFANLSIHYFNELETKNLINEIHRILKNGGILIGTVNSIDALDFINDHVVEIDKHFYQSYNRQVRLFDEGDIDYYFNNFYKLKVEKRTNTRFGNRKDYILFLFKK